MADESHLDAKYFIDPDVYNCPFCKRRHVRYHIYDTGRFNWNDKKTCSVLYVLCHSCKKGSMHLSFGAIVENVLVYDHEGSGRQGPKFKKGIDIDGEIFYSVPTSFFVLDDRIPSIIRDLVSEAEGCQKMNFLTGASACARKAIYELLVREKADGDSYEDKIKSLKSQFAGVDPQLFDVLGHIQNMTSDKVHEQSWPKWDSRNLTLIIEALKAVLYEIYVVPLERVSRSNRVQELLQQVRANDKGAATSAPAKADN